MPSSSLQIQSRDFALLRALFESRVMTSNHAAALFFEGKGEAAKKRLQKLKASGFINERPRHAFEPSVLFLARKGLMLLQSRGVLNEYPSFHLPALDRRARVSDLTIRHELEVMDVKVAFHSAIQATTAFTLVEFTTWPLLNEFTTFRRDSRGAEISVKPDGFIRIGEKEQDGSKFERTFFLEVDRSTEVQEVLVARADCYYEYYKSGGFALRNRARREDYKEYPFRVLLVFKTAERRNNFTERLLESGVPVSNQLWLSTFTEVTTNPLGPIWITPVMYRDAFRGASFKPEWKREPWKYKRQAAREIFVEEKVKKTRLLADESGTPNPVSSPQTEQSPGLEVV